MLFEIFLLFLSIVYLNQGIQFVIISTILTVKILLSVFNSILMFKKYGANIIKRVIVSIPVILSVIFTFITIIGYVDYGKDYNEIKHMYVKIFNGFGYNPKNGVTSTLAVSTMYLPDNVLNLMNCFEEAIDNQEYANTLIDEAEEVLTEEQIELLNTKYTSELLEEGLLPENEITLKIADLEKNVIALESNLKLASVKSALSILNIFIIVLLDKLIGAKINKVKKEIDNEKSC